MWGGGGKVLTNTTSNTPFKLQLISPVVGPFGEIFPSDVCRRPCESVANRPLPCESYGSFKLFKISASEFSTVGMCMRFHACAYEFSTTVTEGVVHSVHKVVMLSSFDLIQ